MQLYFPYLNLLLIVLKVEEANEGLLNTFKSRHQFFRRRYMRRFPASWRLLFNLEITHPSLRC